MKRFGQILTGISLTVLAGLAFAGQPNPVEAGAAGVVRLSGERRAAGRKMPARPGGATQRGDAARPSPRRGRGCSGPPAAATPSCSGRRPTPPRQAPEHTSPCHISAEGSRCACASPTTLHPADGPATALFWWRCCRLPSVPAQIAYVAPGSTLHMPRDRSSSWRIVRSNSRL